MRFNVALLTALLLTVASGLVIPLEKRQSEGALYVHEGHVNDVAASILLKRSDHRSKPNIEKLSTVARVNNELSAFKDSATQAQKDAVAAAYRNTQNLPPHDSQFHVAHSPETGRLSHTFSGADVHTAVLDSHWEAERLKTITSKKKKDMTTLKPFQNLDHYLPKDKTRKPLDHVDPKKGPLWEFHLPNKHDADKISPARIIIQEIGDHHVFQGVIAHDQSRKVGEKGYDDHFQIHDSKQMRTRIRFPGWFSHLAKGLKRVKNATRKARLWHWKKSGKKG